MERIMLNYLFFFPSMFLIILLLSNFLLILLPRLYGLVGIRDFNRLTWIMD